MASPFSLTPVSFVVLGLLERAGEATPYELWNLVNSSIGNFWSIQRSQLYTEPDRLTDAGLLDRDREEGGLRRKRYKLADAGRAALDEWRTTPSAGLPELRDVSLLKLFMGAEPGVLAGAQRDAHRAKLAAYEEQAVQDVGEEPRGRWHALEAGIAHERAWVRFWAGLTDGP